MARTTRPADYVYKRYRIIGPKVLQPTSVSLPYIEHLTM
jgi:hypothetical protein